MAKAISGSYQVAARGRGYAPAITSVTKLAADKENPELWAHKYQFCRAELKLPSEEAITMADNAVQIWSAAKREFNRND